MAKKKKKKTTKKSTSSSSKSSSSSSSNTKSRSEQLADMQKKALSIKAELDKKAKEEKQSTSNKARYETTDGRKFIDKADATAHQRALNASGKGRGSEEDIRENIMKDDEVTDITETSSKSKGGIFDDKELRNSTSFKGLSADQQEAVISVYQAIASNDLDQANRLAGAFDAATALSEPYFKEELRLAKDAVLRGYVAIDQEEEFKQKQLQTRLQDLRQDILTQKDFLSFEEQSILRNIEKQYQIDLDTTQQNLAASGKTRSSQRVKTEQFLAESTGDLRESTTRKFGLEKLELDRNLQRSERDTQMELERLAEVTKADRTNFLRAKEAEIGSTALGSLGLNTKGIDPLGNIVGDLQRRQVTDVLAGVNNLIF